MSLRRNSAAAAGVTGKSGETSRRSPPEQRREDRERIGKGESKRCRSQATGMIRFAHSALQSASDLCSSRALAAQDPGLTRHSLSASDKSSVFFSSHKALHRNSYLHTRALALQLRRRRRRQWTVKQADRQEERERGRAGSHLISASHDS